MATVSTKQTDDIIASDVEAEAPLSLAATIPGSHGGEPRGPRGAPRGAAFKSPQFNPYRQTVDPQAWFLLTRLQDGSMTAGG